MKKLLFTVLAIVVITAGLVVAGDHYKQYQNQKQAQAVPMITVKQADQNATDIKTAAAGEYNSLVVQYNAAVAECQKGVVAYGRLTTVQQHQTAPPVCPAPQK